MIVCLLWWKLNPACNSLTCHSGRILFHTSTVLEMEQDSYGMTVAFVPE